MGCYITPIVTILMSMIFLVDHVESAESCKPTTVQDILDAAYHSYFVYGNVSEGLPRLKVIGSSGNLVDRVFDRVLVGDKLKAIVTTKSSPPTTVICFMGTKSLWQLWHQCEEEVLVNVTIKGVGVKVMRYFLEAFNLLNVHNSIEINPAMKYIVTGHSLGGAIASLFSLYMVEKHGGALWKNPESRLITFGAPRVGDLNYAYRHDQFIPPFKKLRFVNNNDIVPHIAPMCFGFRHESREIWIKIYYEIYWKKCWIGVCPHLRRTKVWIVCPNGDVDSCSRGVMHDSVLDHEMTKYIEDVEEFKEDANEVKRFMSDQC